MPPMSSVAVIALAVTCLATSPPGQPEDRIKQESSKDYSYVYEIKDNSGEGYGKSESRSGEQAIGQYYVNSDQSTTDVKYVADEWGYHPFIKYASALGPGTSSAAHFILGETALKNFRYQQNSLAADEKQIIQAYPAETTVTVLTDKSDLNSNSSAARILERDRDINYVNFAQQPGWHDEISSDGELLQANSATVESNNISEEQLAMKTAGNFGEKEFRIPMALPEHLKVTTTPKYKSFERHQKSVQPKNAEFEDIKKETAKNSTTFVKPIVVAEYNPRTRSYSTSTQKSESLNSNDLTNENDITTSSVVLNPIQAGVSLLNAGNTQLIESEQNPAPVVERIENDKSDYLEYDSDGFESDQTNGNTFEIQKSVEIYNPMPSQEVHYPPEISSIDRQQEKKDDIWNSQRINNQEAFDQEKDAYSTADASNQQTVYVPSEPSPETFKHMQFLKPQPGRFEYLLDKEPHPTMNYKIFPNNNFEIRLLHSPNRFPIKLEKKVPIIIEKKMPFPIPIRIPIVEKPIPVPQPIPVTVEKIIEKKVPYTVQKLVAQAYPVPVPQPVPMPVEKIIEKKVPILQPYPVKIEKIVEKKIPVPVEVTKIVEKPVAVIKNVPFSLPYQMSGYRHEQGTTVMPSSPFFFSLPPVNSTPVYNDYYFSGPMMKSGFPNRYQSGYQSGYQNRYQNGNQNGNQNGYQNGNQNGYLQQNGNQNSFQHLQQNGNQNGYLQQNNFQQNGFQHGNQNGMLMVPASKKVPIYYTIPSNFLYSLFNNGVRRRPLKEIYIGPVPPQTSHKMNIIQSKTPLMKTSTTLSTRSPMQVTVTYRKARQQEAPYTGNFRQSKIEYGFKPPMVPSVQYDEETGSKVESR